MAQHSEWRDPPRMFPFTLTVEGQWQFHDTPERDAIEIWHYGNSKLRIKSDEVEAFAKGLLQAKAQQDLLKATKGIS